VVMLGNNHAIQPGRDRRWNQLRRVHPATPRIPARMQMNINTERQSTYLVPEQARPAKKTGDSLFIVYQMVSV
jgi:hypothetical protein